MPREAEGGEDSGDGDGPALLRCRGSGGERQREKKRKKQKWSIDADLSRSTRGNGATGQKKGSIGVERIGRDAGGGQRKRERMRRRENGEKKKAKKKKWKFYCFIFTSSARASVAGLLFHVPAVSFCCFFSRPAASHPPVSKLASLFRRKHPLF